MTKLLLLAPFALLVGQGYLRPEPPSHVFAAGAKAAVLMAPAEIACASYVRQIAWTSDGAYLVAQRLVVPDEIPARALLVARQTTDLRGIAALSHRTEIVAWSPRTRKSRVLLDYDPAKLTLASLDAIPKGDRLIARATERLVDEEGKTFDRREYLIIAAAEATVTRVPIPDADRPDLLELSSRGEIAIVQREEKSRNESVTFVGSDGRLGRIFALPGRSQFGWQADGAPFVGVLALNEKGRMTYHEHAFDVQSGTIGPLLLAAPEPPEVSAEMKVGETRVTPQGRGVTLAFADGKPEEAGMVAYEGTNPILSPRNDAVAYLSGGSACVRTLKRLARKEYDEAAIDAAREQAMDRAQQVGTALQMYSADADDVMPPSGANVGETVYPYARDHDAFTNFTYTYGGALPKDGLSGIVLGYVSGPGGRAVVHGDGTVTWVPY